MFWGPMFCVSFTFVAPLQFLLLDKMLIPGHGHNKPLSNVKLQWRIELAFDPLQQPDSVTACVLYSSLAPGSAAAASAASKSPL